MKIGVLQAGLVPEGFAPRHGEYDAVFRNFLHLADPEIEVEGWVVVDGEIPDDPHAMDGWIISGSKHGVYEDHTWIPPLEDFIRKTVEARVPLFGVCFGHQIMAQALGGAAEKWSGGWNLGPKTYRVAASPAWLGEAPETLLLHAVHQDQVTTPPPGAHVIAEADGCACAALAYGEPSAPHAISIQPHPEFTEDYARELIELRSGNAFPADVSERALAGMGAPMDGAWAAAWAVRFFRKSVSKN